MDTPPIPSGISDRIEEFLIEYEDRLVAEGLDSEEARRRADEIEKVIRMRLSSDAACRTSLNRLDEFLRTLAQIETPKKSAEFVSFPEGPRLPDQPHIPRVTLFAYGWTFCSLLMLGLLRVPEEWLETENPGFLQKALVNLVVTLGLTAPVGATALALVGLRQIRFGKGRFTGENLTTGMVLFFPTLLVGGLAWWGARTLLSDRLGPGLVNPASLAIALVGAYLWIRIQMKLIADWSARMEVSGRYWTPVGEIPPSRRPASRPPEGR